MKKLIVLVLALATIIGMIFAVNVSAADATKVSSKDISTLYRADGTLATGDFGFRGGSSMNNVFDGNINDGTCMNTANNYIIVDLNAELEGGYYVTEVRVYHVGNAKYSLYYSTDNGKSWKTLTEKSVETTPIFAINEVVTQVKYLYNEAPSFTQTLKEIEVFGIDPAEMQCFHTNMLPDAWVPVEGSATCTVAGDMKQNCPDCGEEVLSLGSYPALGHDIKTTIDREGTATEYGKGVLNCERCDYTINFDGEVVFTSEEYSSHGVSAQFTNIIVSSCADLWGASLSTNLTNGDWGEIGPFHTWISASAEDENEYVLLNFQGAIDLTKLRVLVQNSSSGTLVVSALNAEGEYEVVRSLQTYDSSISGGAAYEMVVSMLGVTTSSLKIQVFDNWNNTNGYYYKRMVIGELAAYGVAQGCGLKAEEHVHEYNDFVEYITVPTCQTAGTATYKCVCNETEVRDVEASEEFHKFVEVEGTRVDATCVAAGSYTGDCEYCDATTTITIEIDAENGHAWTETSKTDADCVNAGAINYDCDNCEATKTEEIAAKGHTYGEAVVVPSTCKDNGTSTKTCTVCGNEDVTTLETTGCTWTIVSYVTEPTCVEAGEANYVCSVCGETKVDTVAATGNHTWDYENAVITTQPTCEGAGWKALTCTVCNGTSRENIPAIGHNVTVESARTEPTCVAKGSVTYVCANGCGRSNTTEIPATGIHNYATEIEKVPATKTEAGYIIYGCTTCEATYTETLPKLEVVIYYVSTADELYNAINGDNPYVMVDGKSVSVQDTDIVRLANDIDLGNKTTRIRKNITLDLYGYTLTTGGNSSSTIMMYGGSLDSSNGMGTWYYYGGSNAVRIYGQAGDIKNIHFVSESTFINSKGLISEAAGITIIGGNSLDEIENVKFSGSTLKAGIELCGTANSITGAVVENATQCALWMNGGTCASISNSTFNGTVGVLFAKTSSATLTNCTVTGTEAAVKVVRDKDTTTKITVNFTVNNTTLTATNGIVVINEDTEKATVATFAVPGFKVEGDKVVCDGEHNYVAVVVDPTCEADGYTRHTCANCGNYYDDTVVPALGHDYEQTGRVEPALGVDGYIEYTCNNCGGKKQEPLCAHDLTVIDSKDATCGVAGYKVYDCTKCEYTYTETIEALKHNYTETRVEPTGTGKENAGSVTFTCGNCGDTSTYDVALFEFDSFETFIAAYALVDEYDIIRMTANTSVVQLKTDSSNAHSAIAKAITIDLNGKILTTTGGSSGIMLGGGASMINGTIIHMGGTSAMKTFNVDKLENINIIVYADYATSSAPVGGISTRNASSDNRYPKAAGEAHINVMRNVKIIGAGNYALEVFNHGLATNENIIGLIENCYFDAYTNGIDMYRGASIGLIKNSVIYGGTNAINVQKQSDNYNVHIAFEGNNQIVGGTNAINISYSTTGNGTVKLIADKYTTFSGKFALSISTANASVIDLVGYTANGNTVTECQHNKVLGNCTTETYCSTCGKVFGYEHAGWTENAEKRVAATCVTLGNAYYNCTACGAEKMELVACDANNHVMGIVKDSRVEPTCTTDGSEQYRCWFYACRKFVDTDTTETRVIPATGHTAGTTVVENNVDPNCTTAGSYDSVVYCTVCNAEISRTPVTVNALGHNLVAGTVVAPTCTAGGYTVYDCSRCDYTENKDATEATGHTAGTPVVENNVDPNCTTTGYYENVVYCTVCKVELSRTPVTVNALGHNLVAGKVVAPNCTTAGYTVYNCSRCDYAENKNETAALGHTEVEIPAVPAYKDVDKVIHAGTTSGIRCSVCDDVIVAPKAVDAKFYFTGNRLSLSDYVNVDYGVSVPSNYKDVYIVFTSDAYEGEEFVYEYDGSGMATYTGIMMQALGDNIYAAMYATTEDGMTAIFVQDTYSVRAYCVSQLTKSTDKKLKTMLSDLLYAGAAAQKHQKYNTNKLVTEGADIEGLLTPSTTTTISGEDISKYIVIDEESRAYADFAGRNLLVGNSMTVQFLLKIAPEEIDNITIEVVIDATASGLGYETFTYSVAEENIEVYDASSNLYIIKVEDLKVIDYDSILTATIYRSGEKISRQTVYSVNSYFERNYNKGEQTMQDFLLAMYKYGVSAYNYKNK